jgi:hypothetical protein
MAAYYEWRASDTNDAAFAAAAAAAAAAAVPCCTVKRFLFDRVIITELTTGHKIGRAEAHD